MSDKVIALTGPSKFTPDCIKMIEDCLKANLVILYQQRMENIQYWLDRAAGIIIAGGVDMHPTLYGENLQTGQGFTEFDYGRDLKELLIIDYCMHAKKPLLGICRGHQLMAVYKGLGRDFIMDLDGRYIHQPGKYNISLRRVEPAHYIELIEPQIFNVKQPVERKVLQELLHDGVENFPIAWVNSYHHQGVKFVKKKVKDDYAKKNLKVLATASSGMSDNCQIIEMMIGCGDEAHWLTTQFHPESDYDENTASKMVIEMFDVMISKHMEGK